MNSRIGQKIVCVNDGNQYYRPSTLVRGVIYTFRGWSNVARTGVMVDEIRLPIINGKEVGHDISRFRPTIGPSAILELINKETVKETSDFPIQIPETV